MISREVIKRLVNVHRVFLVRNSSSNLNIEKLEEESNANSVEG